MVKGTTQVKQWTGDFGREYTDRHVFSIQETEDLYKYMYGISLSKLLTMFLGRMPRDIKILEVGTNVGNQLLMLQHMGFKKLYGIDINPYAVSVAKRLRKGINFVNALASEIPFEDGYFDLVFTAGVLIHIDPAVLPTVLGEIVRCSRKYVWGCEYYAPTLQGIPYRGHKHLMWKGDYAALYKQQQSDLKLVKQKFLKYAYNDNVDHMFLLRKSTRGES